MSVYKIARERSKESANPSMVFSFGADLASLGDANEKDAFFKKLAQAGSTPAYQAAVEEWVEGLKAIGATVQTWRLETPLVVGMGGKGLYEVGFTWLYPYGVPWLPGSGLKGLLRAAAADLWGIIPLLTPERYRPDMSDEELKKEFGSEPEWEILKAWSEIFGSTDGAAAVDCYGMRPRFGTKILRTDVLTPHASGYYRAQKTFKGWKEKVPPPAGKDDPVPVKFVTAKPTFEYVSAYACADPRLAREIAAVLKHALVEMGAGAKTTAGFGRFSPV